MNDNDFYPYAYNAIGKRHYASYPGHYKKRISMIAGLNGKHLQSPFMFQGHCNKKTFELYLEKILVPNLQPGFTIIIDNASFHKSKNIEALITSAGCHLKYLPPYSPDLNPIEHCWHKVKTAIRKVMRDTKLALENAMEVTLKNMAIS